MMKMEEGIAARSLKRVSKIPLDRPKFFMAPTRIKLMMVAWFARKALAPYSMA